MFFAILIVKQNTLNVLSFVETRYKKPPEARTVLRESRLDES